MNKTKSFPISKRLVWEAYNRVKQNRGSYGVDMESMADFERDLKNNLYRIWNRMASGSYFPPAVRAVGIPKKSGGIRLLGVPTISDRIAQTIVKMALEPVLEPIFDRDSYGYRAGKSAHDALAVTRKRCWQYNWVVEFDIKGLFDNLSHALLTKALHKHCNQKWILLYIDRWLRAPMQHPNGTIVERNCGTPQGGVISPLLANLFMHYAFDAWMRREFPTIKFCRYADDALAHCKTEVQAKFLMKRIKQRFEDIGLEIHPDKSGIIYCKDSNRRDEYPVISFDFLGFTFRPRRCVSSSRGIHPNFLPAVSRSSMKDMRRRMRSWHIQLKNDRTLFDLSNMFNPILRGWMQYYAKFYPSALQSLWKAFNTYLVQWARRKYKKLSKHKKRARQYLDSWAHEHRDLFVHWQLGCIPGGWGDRSQVS